MIAVKIVVLLAVASFAISKQQCYRMGLVSDNCDSTEVKVKVVKGSPGARGPVGARGSVGARGPVGAPGINGKPCEASANLLKNLSAMLETKLGKMESSMETKLGKMESSMETKLGQMESSMETKFGKMETKLGKMETKFGKMESSMEGKFGKIQTYLDAHNNTNSKKPEPGKNGGEKNGGGNSGKNGGGDNGQHLSTWTLPNMMDTATVEAKFEAAYINWPQLWDGARKMCKEISGNLIPAEYINTKEKLLSLFGVTFRLTNYYWVGVRYRNGFYHYENGKKINMTTFPWRNNQPVKYDPKKRNGYVMCNMWDCVNRNYDRSTGVICYMPNRKKFRPPGTRKYFKAISKYGNIGMSFYVAHRFCLKKGGRLPQYNLFNKAGLKKFYKEAKDRNIIQEYLVGLAAEYIGPTRERFHFLSGIMPFHPKNEMQQNFGRPGDMSRSHERCAWLVPDKAKQTMVLRNYKCYNAQVVCEFSS